MIKNIILLLVTFGVTISMIEVGLRVATPFPVTEESNKKDHAQLVYTLDPALPDVDARGFRNSQWTPDEADLAVVGDSHTYGVNVAAEQNFPSVLGAKIERPTYNFGVSSYGIYQYHVLIGEAIDQGVDDIVVGLYPANDLALNCDVLGTDYWQHHAKALDLTLPDCTSEEGGRSSALLSLGGIKSFVAGTATLQIARDLVWNAVVGEAGPSVDAYFLFDQGQAVSRRRVGGHSKAASLDDPAVRANFENSKRLFLDNQTASTDASIGFSITILPSKERVLHAWLQRHGKEIDPKFAEDTRSELALVEAYTAFFDTHDIAYSDALPDVVDAFERVLAAGGDFYPVGNGHPFEEGYSAYAEAAVRGLERSQERLQLTRAD